MASLLPAVVVAWYLVYPCWYGPDEKPIGVFAGSFTSYALCKKFQTGMGIFIGPLVWTETECVEMNGWPPPTTCPDTKQEE